MGVTALDDNIMVRQKKRAVAAHKDKMKRLFRSADTEGDGKIDIQEFQEILRDDRVRQWLAAMDFPTFTTIEEINRLFDTMDVDHSGQVTLEELSDGVSRMKGFAKSSE